MDKKIRIFRSRFLIMLISLGVLGMEFILLQMEYLQGFFERLEHWIWILVMLLFFIAQWISQLAENTRAITKEEFHSASIFKFRYLSKPFWIRLDRLVMIIFTWTILFAQITLLVVNWFENESLISPILGILAMSSLLAFQGLAQYNENRITSK